MSIRARSVTPLLEVFDMRRSVAFYRDVLGFEVVQQSAPDGHLYWAMLKLGGAVVMLNARYEAHAQPAAPDAVRAAGHADTELFFDCRDVDEAFRHLRAAGVAVSEPQTTAYGMRTVWVADPDG